VEIDYADAWDFIDDDGRPFKLRFRRNLAPRNDPRVFDGTGQLVGVLADSNHPDYLDEIALSRPNVRRVDVESAIDGWEEWARVLDTGTHCWLSVARIRIRIHDAGLD
jgi:hypothetical protein